MDKTYNTFAYMRICTGDESGVRKYNRQENALRKYAKEHGIETLLFFKENISGNDFYNRKQWKKLEQLLKPGDTIIFKDISRFTREAENGYKKYMELLKKDINLVFIDNLTISSEYIRHLFRVAEEQNLVTRISLETTVKLLLIAELNRMEKLVVFTGPQDGIASAPKKAGRAKGHLDKMTPELEIDLRKYLTDQSITQTSLMNKYKVSRNTLKKYASIISKEENISVTDRK